MSKIELFSMNCCRLTRHHREFREFILYEYEKGECGTSDYKHGYHHRRAPRKICATFCSQAMLGNETRRSKIVDGREKRTSRDRNENEDDSDR